MEELNNNQAEQNNSEQATPEINTSDMNNTSPEEVGAAKPEKKFAGQIIGIVIIIGIIIIGGLYFYGKSLYQAAPIVDEDVTGAEILERPDATTEALEQQGTSDEIVDIEEDLNVTDLDNLDAELENIDVELGL